MRKFLHWPTAASVFAGLLGAGVIDVLVTEVRASQSSFFGVLALSLGLYGAAGLFAGTLAGWAVAIVQGALPTGAQRLTVDADGDHRLAGAILAGAAGALTLALGLAAAHAGFVAPMASKRLAVIATGGLALALCPVGVVVALACRRLAHRVAGWLPRPGRLGRTGLLVSAFAVGGVVAGIVALTRADWQVLDLGPLESIAVATLFGVAHGVFWYVTPKGRQLQPRLPLLPIRTGTVALVLLLLLAGAHTPETSAAFQGITDGALGLRWGVRLARALTDHDGDGFSARFGGGDFDDHHADVFPGAE